MGCRYCFGNPTVCYGWPNRMDVIAINSLIDRLNQSLVRQRKVVASTEAEIAALVDLKDKANGQASLVGTGKTPAASR